MECQESNPPDDHSFNRMSMGHMAEVLIVRNLHKNGWQTDHTVLSPTGQLELEFQIPGTDVVLIGHPDGICMHPEFTKSKWAPLECKSMSVMRGEETQEKGVTETYPEYITQISLYGRELHRMGLIEHPNAGVFAMMDRDGRPLPPERVSWKQHTVDETLEKLKEIVETVERGEITREAIRPQLPEVPVLQLQPALPGPGGRNSRAGQGQKQRLRDQEDLEHPGPGHSGSGPKVAQPETEDGRCQGHPAEGLGRRREGGRGRRNRGCRLLPAQEPTGLRPRHTGQAGPCGHTQKVPSPRGKEAAGLLDKTGQVKGYTKRPREIFMETVTPVIFFILGAVLAGALILDRPRNKVKE